MDYHDSIINVFVDSLFPLRIQYISSFVIEED